MKNKANAAWYAIIVFLLLLTGFFSINLFLREKAAMDRIDIHKFPLTIGDWAGREISLKEEEYRILETKNLIYRQYENPEGKRIGLFIIYSETNRAVFHPPEVCLIGDGVTIVGKENAGVAYPDSITREVNKLLLEKNGTRQLVLYCYKADSLYTENFYLQQVYLIFHQIFGRQVPGATIRVEMPIGSDEKETLAILKDFLAQVVKQVDDMTRSSS